VRLIIVYKLYDTSAIFGAHAVLSWPTPSNLRFQPLRGVGLVSVVQSVTSRPVMSCGRQFHLEAGAPWRNSVCPSLRALKLRASGLRGADENSTQRGLTDYSFVGDVIDVDLDAFRESYWSTKRAETGFFGRPTVWTQAGV